ncbi:hypothetical protein ACFX1Q_040953 [Malus domestica]
MSGWGFDFHNFPREAIRHLQHLRGFTAAIVLGTLRPRHACSLYPEKPHLCQTSEIHGSPPQGGVHQLKEEAKPRSNVGERISGCQSPHLAVVPTPDP